MAVVLWLIAMVVFSVLEAATTSLVTIWFAIGAIGGAAAALLGAGTLVQFAVFVLISVVMLIFTRPAAKKLMPRFVPTNAELDVGRTAVVIQRIDGEAGSGRIRLDGVDWAARSADGSDIEEGASVTVVERGTTTLTVRVK